MEKDCGYLNVVNEETTVEGEFWRNMSYLQYIPSHSYPICQKSYNWKNKALISLKYFQKLIKIYWTKMKSKNSENVLWIKIL